jgi:ATPase subunit of ABC transporter with duplicated ATPase domains
VGAHVASRASGQVQGAPAAYETLLAEDGRKRDGRRDRHSAGPRLGDIVVEAEQLDKGYGDRLLIDDSRSACRAAASSASSGQRRGQDHAVPHDHGQEKPDGGSCASARRCSSPTSTRAARRSTETDVWEEISGGAEQLELGKRRVHSRAYVASFNFKGSDQQKKVGDLSGGERNRVHLAKLLKSGGNLLLLDEPTNDLDVDTLRALEDALLAFAGCAW